MFFSAVLCVSFFLSLVHAFPLAARDVVDPHITSPDASSVWLVGSTQTVTWDTTDVAASSNPLGKVVLGFQTADSENLNLDSPLAQNFNLTDGKVNVVVPDVPLRHNYIIILFGDSGNASPQFTIQPANTTASSPAPGGSSSTLITTPIPITGSVITTASTTVSVTPTSTSIAPSAPSAPSSAASGSAPVSSTTSPLPSPSVSPSTTPSAPDTQNNTNFSWKVCNAQMKGVAAAVVLMTGLLAL